MNQIIEFFKALFAIDPGEDGKVDIVDVINKAKEIAELYAAVSGDPRAQSAITVTSLIFDANDKLKDETTTPEERLNIIQELITAIKAFD